MTRLVIKTEVMHYNSAGREFHDLSHLLNRVSAYKKHLLVKINFPLAISLNSDKSNTLHWQKDTSVRVSITLFVLLANDNIHCHPASTYSLNFEASFCEILPEKSVFLSFAVSVIQTSSAKYSKNVILIECVSSIQ